MAEEKQQFEERTVTLKVTKRRLTPEEKEAHELKNGKTSMTESGEGGGQNCGNWYLVWYQQYQAWFSCRICYQGYPTAWPYEECVQMPE